MIKIRITIYNIILIIVMLSGVQQYKCKDVKIKNFNKICIYLPLKRLKRSHYTPEINALDTPETTTIYSSCNDITEDGLYYIKPTPDLPVLPVICSNGYTMIDASLDANLNTIPLFLSSWDYPRLDTQYIFSNLDDISTFREWFLPADENTKFNIAPSCLQCQPGDFGDNTVYYISSHSYCPSGSKVNGCIEDTESADYHIEGCNTCDSGTYDTDGNWIKCFGLHLSSDYAINHDHTTCVTHGLTFRPTISMIRDVCTCYKPLEANGVMKYEVHMSKLPLVTCLHKHRITDAGFTIADNIQFEEDEEGDDDDDDDAVDNRSANVVYLYNSDFIDGTYRIKESGTYILMEDIMFNFNAPTDDEMNREDFSPNSIYIDELYWYPTHDQADPINGNYPGLYSFSGDFTLGFFAGITIETEYVTIDLNRFTLSMNYKFYFQQRFFALIELASQPFVPGQGPANWRPVDVMYAKHVIIKNGNLGLSSHQSIHGNNNDDVIITNVNCFNFDVSGIQCNGCTNVIVSDVIIGPQNNNIPLLGRYTHARAYLPRLTQLLLNHGDESIQFYNREPMTISYLIDRLINQMDMIYFHFINEVEYDDENNIEWKEAKKLFSNPTGWMDGGSSYGLIFGGSGAQVVGIGSRTTSTSNVSITNVEIFGIYNNAIEKIQFADGNGATRLIFFDAIDWVAISDQINDMSTSNYIGDAYSDLTFAINNVTDSWYFKNSLYVTSSETSYVFEGDKDALTNIFEGSEKNAGVGQGCNSDIQLHSSKGSIGLRIDGVENLNIDNIYIHDIYNWADLGTSLCGAYEGPSNGGESIDIQYGYCGTRSHGMITDFVSGEIKNIHIQNIESYNGEANGMTIYKESYITLENINVDYIYAGTQLNDEQIHELSDGPNLIPRACGVDIRDNTVVVINNDIGIINGENIIGFNTCYDDDDSSNNSNSRLVMVCMLSSLLIVVYIIGRNTMHYIRNNYKIKNMSEYTPLLYAVTQNK